jgi:hypothetical protein
MVTPSCTRTPPEFPLSANPRRPRSDRPTRHQRQLQRRREASAQSSPDRATGSGSGAGSAPGSLRHSVERRSAGMLMVLHRMPRWLMPLLMAGLFLVGVIVRGPVGVVAIALVLVFLTWLSYLSWTAVTGRGRLTRLLTLGLLTGLLVMQILR